MSNLNKAIMLGAMWSIVGQFGTMAVSLITNIILARVLSPYQFGQIGIVMFFVVLANVLAESGLGGAIVRKKEATHDDFSTVFVFNILVSTICFLILVTISGAISLFYKDSSLQNILIVTAFILIINAFQITQNAQLIRNLKFKQVAIYKFFAVCTASVIGILLASIGFGVWALVCMQIFAALFYTLILWYYEGSFLSLKFSKKSFKGLYSFGVNVSLASLLNTAFDNIYQLVLGRFFSLVQVGLFYQAKKLQEVPIGIMRSITLGVVFSSLSKLQDEHALFVITYKKLLLLFTTIMGVLTSIIFVFSEGIVKVLYGKEWEGVALYMQLLTIGYFFFMQEMFNRVVFKVYDQTHKILIIEIIKKLIQSITIVVGVLLLDINILLFGFIGSSIISYLINIQFSRKIVSGIAKGEILLVTKIVIVSTMVILITKKAESYLAIEGVYSLTLLPVLLFFYFILVKVIGVFDVIKESKAIIKLFRYS